MLTCVPQASVCVYASWDSAAPTSVERPVFKIAASRTTLCFPSHCTGFSSPWLIVEAQGLQGRRVQ